MGNKHLTDPVQKHTPKPTQNRPLQRKHKQSPKISDARSSLRDQMSFVDVPTQRIIRPEVKPFQSTPDAPEQIPIQRTMWPLKPILQRQSPPASKAGTPFQMPPKPSVITVAYWQGLTDPQRKTLHYGRNQYQANVGIPALEKSLVSGEWEDKGVAIAHNLAGASGNKDYRGVGAREGQQAIYDTSGKLVTSPENLGTYDFASPGVTTIRDHWILDVNPWVKWGNAPNDSTTKQQRIDALKATNMGYIGYQMYGE